MLFRAFIHRFFFYSQEGNEDHVVSKLLCNYRSIPSILIFFNDDKAQGNDSNGAGIPFAPKAEPEV